jgi:hypothetical protein
MEAGTENSGYGRSYTSILTSSVKSLTMNVSRSLPFRDLNILMRKTRSVEKPRCEIETVRRHDSGKQDAGIVNSNPYKTAPSCCCGNGEIRVQPNSDDGSRRLRRDSFCTACDERLPR